MAPSAPTLLEQRYRLDGRLAARRFCEVWRATDVRLNRRVAVKLLRPGYSEHPETLTRFRSGARHAGALCHQNIARVFDYGEPPAVSVPYLVTELVDGPSLAGLLRAGPLPPARVMDIVAQVAAGLEAAHRAGLGHCGIHPGNLLLGEDGVVKITDFVTSYAAACDPLTSAGLVPPAPGYTAPELIDGGHAGAASDLYSLGAVAAECLTGAEAFGRWVRGHRSRPLQPLPDGVPADVAALVAELTAADPAARTQSAGEVAHRAARLRDLLADGHGGVPAAGGRAAAAGARVEADGGERLTSAGRMERPAASRETAGGRGVAGLAAAALVALAAAVAGLILASATGAAAPSRPAAVPSATAPALTPKPAQLMVDVNGSALIGEPVAAVVSRLQRLGLVTHVLWYRSGRQPVGRVLSVRPAGRLAAGSRITVTGALATLGGGQPPAKATSPAKPGTGRQARHSPPAGTNQGPPGRHPWHGPPGHAGHGPRGHAGHGPRGHAGHGPGDSDPGPQRGTKPGPGDGGHGPPGGTTHGAPGGGAGGPPGGGKHKQPHAPFQPLIS